MLKGSASFDQGVFLMHLTKGKEYFDHNELEKARIELEAAYHLRPQDEKVLNMLGMTYYKMEMLPQAEEMYVALSAGNPDIYTLQSNLGLIRLKLDKLDLATESLTRALELQAANPKAHFYLGLLYEKKEDWQQALYHFQFAKADKMVSKIQEKIKQERLRATALLPFQVLEVIAIATVEPPPAPVSQQAASPAAIDWMEPSTGRMLRQDVIEASGEARDSKIGEMIKQVQSAMTAESPMYRKDEIVSEDTAKIRTIWNNRQDTEKLKLQEMLESMSKGPELSAEEKELFEDTAEAASTESDADSELWEKTQPTLLLPESPAAPVETPPVQTPFLIAEDVAADISTFLAESRTENATKESEETPSDDYRETQEQMPTQSGAMTSSAQQTIDTAEMDSAALMASLLPRNHSKEEEEEEVELMEDEEILEDENPDDEAEPGRLEPSTLTPALTDSLVEFTQEISKEKSVSEPASTPDVSAPVVGIAGLTPSQVDATIPVTPMGQAFQPANLDQFSRDRFYVQPLIGADRFLLIDPHLLEIVMSEKMICRSGTISSYTGNLHFDAWHPEYENQIPLVQVTGTGILFLADKRKEIFILSLNYESITVEVNHLLVAQSILKIDPHVFRGVSIVRISGRGTLALACQTKPLTLNVQESLPVNIPAEALIAWSGQLTAAVIEDEELRKIMMSSENANPFLRFTGSGDVVVEQGGLWGDRRAKK